MYRRAVVLSDGIKPAETPVLIFAGSHPPLVGYLNITGLLALVGILGPPIMFGCELMAAFAAPRYSIIQDSISSLAWTKLGWVQTIGFLAIGLMVEMYVAGFLLNIHPRRGFRMSAMLLVLSGFGLLMIGAFHTDVGGLPTPSLQGMIHGIASKGVFVIFPIAAFLMSFSIKRDRLWRHLHLYTLITAIMGFILVVAVWLVNNTSWFGGVERLLVANMIIWVEVTAIQLLRHSLRKPQRPIRSVPF